MIAALEARGVLARWGSRNAESKKSLDITTDSALVSSIHSVKGLDFKIAYIFGLDSLDLNSEEDRRLAHVGIPRARERLTICLEKPTPLEDYLR